MERIKQAIVSEQYLPGQRLPSIKSFAKEFGVGESSVREAIRVLNSKGVLNVVHGSGTFVREQFTGVPIRLSLQIAELEERSLTELFEARRALEPELAALAALRATDDDRRAILNAAAKAQSAAKASQKVVGPHEDYLHAEVAFHEAIASAARNSIVTQMLDGIRELLVDSRRVTIQVPGAPSKAALYHQLIADAINERDAEQARALMYAHLTVGLHRMQVREQAPTAAKNGGSLGRRATALS